MKLLLPQTYDTLAEFIDQLPGAENVPTYPFAGFAINLNCTTRIHQDRNDKDICFIIVISNCTGGDGALILFELGLIVAAASGTGILFPSSRISHCNNHFKGHRASLVFHTDNACDAWTSRRIRADGLEVTNNGWSTNKYFRV